MPRYPQMVELKIFATSFHIAVDKLDPDDSYVADEQLGEIIDALEAVDFEEIARSAVESAMRALKNPVLKDVVVIS